jgi:lysophospholipase L1-like esterase
MIGMLAACALLFPAPSDPVERPTVVHIGDSISHASTDELAAMYDAAGYDAWIDARPGRSITEPLYTTDSALDAADRGAEHLAVADVVVIALGTNDIMYPDPGQHRLDAILDRVPESAYVMWVDVYRPGLPWEAWNGLVEADSRIDSVVHWSSVRNLGHLFVSDGFHPNQAGQDTFAALIRRDLVERDARHVVFRRFAGSLIL